MGVYFLLLGGGFLERVACRGLPSHASGTAHVSGPDVASACSAETGSERLSPGLGKPAGPPRTDHAVAAPSPGGTW